jgi:hypothetical protein
MSPRDRIEDRGQSFAATVKGQFAEVRLGHVLPFFSIGEDAAAYDGGSRHRWISR